VYCKKIYLESEDAIKRFAIADIAKQLPISKILNRQIKIHHILPDDLLQIINLELDKYNIPPILYCLSYIRPKSNFQGIHIDGDQNGIISSSINIPLKGHNDSYQIWYKGNFTTAIVKTENNVYHRTLWEGSPKEDFRVEINQAYLVRVDRPHSALSNNFEERWVFTMRFRGNPNFEELIKNV
jgi:hypothetical protein